MIRLSDMTFLEFRKESTNKIVGVFQYDYKDGYTVDIYVMDKEDVILEINRLKKEAIDTSSLDKIVKQWPN